MKSTAWKIAFERAGEKGPYLIVDSSDKNVVIAKVPAALPRNAREDVADLLAGAPEMYEACKAVVAAHDEQFKDAPLPHCFCEEVCLPLLYVLDLCDGTVRREAREAAKARRAKARKKKSKKAEA